MSSLACRATYLQLGTGHERFKLTLIVGVFSEICFCESSVNVFVDCFPLTSSSNFLFRSTFGGDNRIDEDSFSEVFSVGEKDPGFTSRSSTVWEIASN